MDLQNMNQNNGIATVHNNQLHSFHDHSMSIMDKLGILADAAKYDVACTSSGVDRAGVRGQLGSAAAAGICHSFASDGRCISLLKVLMSNACTYD